MKIVAIADLHYSIDSDESSRAEAIAAAVRDADADVLVVAGDCAAEGGDAVGAALAMLAGFDGPRLMVPGNHDLWEDRPPFHTRRIYQQRLPEVAAEHGFTMLDQGPVVIADTAFVGCMGWYDYSMRQQTAPREGLTVTPIAVEPGAESGASFSAVPGAEEGPWDGLEAADYAANGLVWQGDGSPRVAVWNDALHLDWEHDAARLARRFADQLRAQIEAVGDRARRVVGVTHFVPFAELAEATTENPTRAFARAYLGSPLLGEALLEARELALVIYGHRHHQRVVEVRGVPTADASVHGRNEGPLLLTLPE